MTHVAGLPEPAGTDDDRRNTSRLASLKKAFREYVPSVRQALEPGVLRDYNAARSRSLSIPQLRAARSARLDLLPDLQVLARGTTFDLGANVGDWTAAALAVEPQARIVAVEPGPQPRGDLERRFRDDRRVTVDPRAVSDTAGTTTLFVTDHSHNSSIRPPLDMSEMYHGAGWGVSETVEVECVTLDELCAGHEIALLKLDVQGAELSVLTASTDALRRTQTLLLEVTFVSHYEGDATFPTLHGLLEDAGFELVGLSPPHMSRTNTALWADACYQRAGTGVGGRPATTAPDSTPPTG